MKMNTTSRSSKKGAKNQTVASALKSRKDIASELQELFEKELKEIYWSEKALLNAIPKMIKNASDLDLIEALESHLSETEGHTNRAEEVFDSIGLKPEAKKCEAMIGLIKESDKIMSETLKGVIRDAGIISAVQKIEHYEIATYGTLRSFALTLGHDEAVDLLEETLKEEKGADISLTEIAESSINEEAVSE